MITREHNVDFTIRNSQADSFIPQTEGTKKLLKVQLQTQLGLVTIFSAYPPTLISIQEAKDKFYDEFSAAINEVPFQEPLFILGGFNTRVGSDHHSWPACLGQFRTGKMSVKGQHLLKLCCQQNLYITNTFFNTKPQHKVSWRHPRSNYWHQLDLIITRCSSLHNIKTTYTYQSADYDTNHSLVCSKVKWLHHTKKEGRSCITVSNTHDPAKVTKFMQAMEEALPVQPGSDVSKRWEHLWDTIYNPAMSIFGKRMVKSGSWFIAHSLMSCYH